MFVVVVVNVANKIEVKHTQMYMLAKKEEKNSERKWMDRVNPFSTTLQRR